MVNSINIWLVWKLESHWVVITDMHFILTFIKSMLSVYFIVTQSSQMAAKRQWKLPDILFIENTLKRDWKFKLFVRKECFSANNSPCSSWQNNCYLGLKYGYIIENQAVMCNIIFNYWIKATPVADIRVMYWDSTQSSCSS